MTDDDLHSTAHSLIRLDVPSQAAGSRLDKWLAEKMDTLSRSRLKGLLENGHISLEGLDDVLSPSRKIKAGECYLIDIPPPAPAEPQAEDIELDVVYEDTHLIVINKPAGMVVHPAPGTPGGTLVNAMLHHCGESLSGIGGVLRPGIVHRIDKETSGLLVVAKSDAAHQGLAVQFADHSITRKYRAIAYGAPNPANGRITGNIGRHPVDRKRMAVVENTGKHAVTHYRTLNNFHIDSKIFASEIECQLETGRTHQVRVHMNNIGNSLLGDPVYGRKPRIDPAKFPALSSAMAKFNRQALHAEHLGFIHPVTNTPLNFDTSPPHDMQEMMKTLAACQKI